MEVLDVTLDLQGTRVYGAGGMMRFEEDWMRNNKMANHKILVAINGDGNKKYQNNESAE